MLLLTRLELETIRDALVEEWQDSQDALLIVEAVLLQDDHKQLEELLK